MKLFKIFSSFSCFNAFFFCKSAVPRIFIASSGCNSDSSTKNNCNHVNVIGWKNNIIRTKYYSMIYRCYNPNAQEYYNYGVFHSHTCIKYCFRHEYE